MSESCGTARRGSPTAAVEGRPAPGRSRTAPIVPSASRTAGPIVMCQVSGGIQATWWAWVRLNRIRGSAPATAAVAATAQRSPAARPAFVHSRVVRCAGRMSSDSQFSSAHTRTVPPYATQRAARPLSSRRVTRSRVEIPAPADTSAYGRPSWRENCTAGSSPKASPAATPAGTPASRRPTAVTQPAATAMASTEGSRRVVVLAPKHENRTCISR